MSILLEQAYTDRDETGKLVQKVVDYAYDSVVSTMGPNGNLAMIIEANQPVVTKDGVRVAKGLDFNDIRMNSIAKLITSAAIKTDDTVGDGTTTTVMMVRNLYKRFGTGLNFYSTKLIDELVAETKALLEDLVMTITPEDEEFSRMIYTTSNYQKDIAERVIAIFKEHNNPNLQLKRGRGNPEDIIEQNHLVKFDGRYPHGSLKPNTHRNATSVKGAPCYVINGYVRNIDTTQTAAICNYVVAQVTSKLSALPQEEQTQAVTAKLIAEAKPFVILGRDFEGGVLDAFVQMNQWISAKLGTNDRLWVVPFTIAGGGTSGTEIVNDLCRVLGIASYSDFSQLMKTDHVDTITGDVSIDLSGILLDPESEIEEGKTYRDNIDIIMKSALPVYEGMNYTEKASPIGQILFSRISRLRGENVTIWVSGMTDAEISERFYLYEDAVKVAASSIRFGVIPGIGWGYNQAAQKLYAKYSHLTQSTGKRETVTWAIIHDFLKVLVAQYEHLSDEDYDFEGDNRYMDLVTGEVSDRPENVYDNGSAAIVALEGGWSVVKRLGKLSCILGKSNTSYQM